MIDRIQFTTGPAVGSAGVATATGYSVPVHGEILLVYVDYKGSPPAGTCDFTLKDEDDPSNQNIVSLVDTASDARIYTRRNIHTNTKSDITYDGTRKVYDYYMVHGRLEATIAQANADDYCDVTVWIRT